MTSLIRNSVYAVMSLAILAIALPTGAQDLWTAAAEGDTKTIKQLLKDGHDINALDPTLGATALTFAVFQNKPKAVRLLAKSGADVTSGGAMDGNTALHAAVFLGYDKVVKELLRAGADPMQANNQGQTPPAVAATDWGTTQAIASMLQLTVNEDEVTSGREKALELIEKQINKLARSDIWLAVYSGNERYVKRLARKTKDLNAPDESGQTTLIGAAATMGFANIVDILADAGADVNVQGGDGATPLLVASFFGRADTVKVLLEHGADKSIANNDGTTPLVAANADMALVDYIAGLLNLELDYKAVIEGKKAIASLLSAN
ncbi:MAG: ankyrin repeat domain-containing protein [Gammaproteobacteria bacterium]|nr:ankyrin repeat domain-containing protein [Gammaproteobacteria bacterium]